MTQITATLLIATKIYYASRLTIGGSPHSSRYMTLIWLVVESGAIYTSAALIQLVTYLEKMNAGVILEFILSQLSAMVPVLIVVRVGLGYAFDGGSTREDVVELTTFQTTTEKTTVASLTVRDSNNHFSSEDTRTNASIAVGNCNSGAIIV
ncbi:hypothetical protein Hypma_005079 [Hypsizygus marmoreus]|uniref:Uncharacterized protein n=1 Tax=Hypsizygus marmoreus TaxID=39966 RepID=A0A369K2Z3_HYPMA|nr:hypothetical protein Hypma_005079 [Hypsizygus marmoreus]